MDDAGPGPESHAKGFESLAFEAVLLQPLAAPTQPQPLQVASEVAQVRVAGRCRVVFQPSVQHLPEPNARSHARPSTCAASIAFLSLAASGSSASPSACGSIRISRVVSVGNRAKARGNRRPPACPARHASGSLPRAVQTRAGVSCRRAGPIHARRASPSRSAGSVPHRCGLGSRARSHPRSAR